MKIIVNTWGRKANTQYFKRVLEQIRFSQKEAKKLKQLCNYLVICSNEVIIAWAKYPLIQDILGCKKSKICLNIILLKLKSRVRVIALWKWDYMKQTHTFTRCNHRFLEGWPTDCFWADAPYTQGGAAHCKPHIL